jgi:hypothetical protein
MNLKNGFAADQMAASFPQARHFDAAPATIAAAIVWVLFWFTEIGAAA